MSNYKPFEQQVAEQFVKRLEAGTSPLQPGNNFQTPVNASTGKIYRGLNAIHLAMQPFPDPRWMTLNQANKMQIKIPKGTTGTMINVIKTAETFPVLDDNGKRMKDENGKPKSHTVQLENPIEETHWVFNASQLAIGQQQNPKNELDSGIDRLHKFIAAAGITLVAGKTNEASYDLAKDRILVAKDPNHYKTEADYGAAVLQQLASWTAHPERLNRDISGAPGEVSHATEQLRTAVATLFLASEMDLPFPADQYEKVVPEWAALLKTDPGQLRKSAFDGQRIVDYILETEKELGLRKGIAPKPMPLDLAIGDEIKYGGTTYKVLESMKGNKLKIEDQNSGAKLPITPNDGLYKSLVQAKYRGPEPAAELGNDLTKSNEIANDQSNDVSANRTIKR